MKKIHLIVNITLLILITALTVHAETSFIVMGTMGGPVPAPDRGQPSNLLIVNGEKTLVDVGDGTAQRLSKLRLPTAAIDNILISHLHFDHMGGLQAMIGLRFQTNSPKPLQIYGPPGTETLVDGLLASMIPAMEANYGIPGETAFTMEQLVKTHVIKAGNSFMLGDTKVMVAQNTHYSFPVDNPKGKKFQSLSFRFETPDKTIVYTSDTGPSTEVEELAKGTDILISEMLDVEMTVNLIKRVDPDISPKRLEGMKIHFAKHHLTPTDLGKMAANTGVKQLVVTHLVPGGTMKKSDLDSYMKEIAFHYKGKITIANDMDRF